MIHLIIIGQGCSNQLDDSHSENKEDIKTRSFSYCPGNKECIPVVVVQHFGSYSSTPGTLISWSGNIVDNCNFFTLEVKCKTINYNATHYIQPSGSIYLSHNLDEYTLDYKIGCSSDSRCDHSEEHFIYGTYSWQQCDMGQGLSIPYLQERLHPGGGI